WRRSSAMRTPLSRRRSTSCLPRLSSLTRAAPLIASSMALSFRGPSSAANTENAGQDALRIDEGATQVVDLNRVGAALRALAGGRSGGGQGQARQEERC